MDNHGHKFHEVFQLRQGRGMDLSPAKIAEMMKSNSLDNAPTQSLLSVVNDILDEIIGKKNGEVPHRIACLLRRVVQEIERRISSQAEHLRTQNNLIKAREEKYQSRIRVLETLAADNAQVASVNGTNGTSAEDMQKLIFEKEKQDKELAGLRQALEVAMRQHDELVASMKEKEQRILEVSVKQELELAKVRDESACRVMVEKELREREVSVLKKELDMSTKGSEELMKLMKEKELKDEEIQNLKQELEVVKFGNNELTNLTRDKNQMSLEISSLRQELELAKQRDDDGLKLFREKEQKDLEISMLKNEMQINKRSHELRYLEMEAEAKAAKVELESRFQEVQKHLEQSKNRVTAPEADSNSKNKAWSKNKQILDNFANCSIDVLKGIKSSSTFMKHEILKARNSHLEDLHTLGSKLRVIIEGTENYHQVMSENRKLFNELQELKGNIRVYCRIRPQSSGKEYKQSIIEFIGENGELAVTNPSKQAKEGRKIFRFNKVYGPTATQADVFSDTQPLVRSVLDGFNVCIFAYGQTGSGKTYTMSGPNGASPQYWGVNYRALNDLFTISAKRSGSFTYEVGVQMIEIYNEQIRDLLSTDSSQRKLGIVSTSQQSSLAVPDATIHPVTSTSDVLDLMDIGLKNRAVGATALNERSSRSHSVVSIHVRGKDLQNGSSLVGNLHLVDLAGSERVDRSEVTGDRLKEAQHINKSLSSLGDVIFALAQKNTHVPYRNSKLTQLLQSSLGGRAKTLMFVQLNPDLDSYSESMSTLKFAERVSGVELGAAKSSKDNKDVKELMDQIASLRETISRKNNEIEKLQQGKGYSSPGGESADGFYHQNSKAYSGRSSGEEDNSVEDMKRPFSGNSFGSKSAATDLDQDNSELIESVDNEERLSDLSDGNLSKGTESDATSEDGSKVLHKLRVHGKVASRIRTLQKAAGQGTKKTTTPTSSTIMKPSSSAKRWV